MKSLAAAVLAVAAAGCASAPPAATVATTVAPRTVVATSAPSDGLWVTLRGRAEHRLPTGHAPTVSWVPIAHLIDEGVMVQPGDELLRFAEDNLRERNANARFDLANEEQRRRLDLLRMDGDIAQLRARIHSLESQARVLAAELSAAEVVDADIVRISELQLANATAAHAAAARRRERLEGLAAAGGAVSAADLAQACDEEVRTQGGIAAPTAALELARLPAAASTVTRLRLALAEVRAQLGETAEEGLVAELRTADERRRRREQDVSGLESRRREFQFQRREALLKDPVIRASASGMVQFRDPDVRVGGKLPQGVACIFVLDRAGLAVRLAVPERMRDLIGVGTRIVLALPGLAAAPLHGTVASLAAAPEDGRNGQRSFPAMVSLDAAPAGLRPGMSAEARIAIAIPRAPALIPSFCVIDSEAPRVRMADGSDRRLEGWSVSGWFVAISGLAPGEQVRVPEDAPVPGRLRLSALIEPERSVPVILRSGSWEPIELALDGTMVKAGQRLARLAKTEFWRTPEQVRVDTDLNMAWARFDLAVAQMTAADNRARARGDWLRAVIGRDRARLEARVARYAWDPVAEAQVAAAVAAAGVDLDRAGRELAVARRERTVGAIGDAQLRDRELDRIRAELAQERCRLDAAAAELGKDQIELRRLDDATSSADEAEAASRAQRGIAGETYRAKLASAAATFESVRRSVESQLRSIADEEVVAPVDGLLVYTRTGDGLPRVGRELQTLQPFRIAIGNRRRAVFELPARLFGRLQAGDRIRLSGGGPDDRVEAEVVKVAAAFLPSRDLAAELALGRTVGDADRIFQVTVAFDPPGGDPARMAPGMGVYADF